MKTNENKYDGHDPIGGREAWRNVYNDRNVKRNVNGFVHGNSLYHNNNSTINIKLWKYPSAIIENNINRSMFWRPFVPLAILCVVLWRVCLWHRRRWKEAGATGDLNTAWLASMKYGFAWLIFEVIIIPISKCHHHTQSQNKYYQKIYGIDVALKRKRLQYHQ